MIVPLDVLLLGFFAVTVGGLLLTGFFTEL